MKKKIFTSIIGLFTIALFSVQSQVVEEINPVADSQVTWDTSTANLGNETVIDLCVRTDGGRREGYMKFDISNVDIKVPFTKVTFKFYMALGRGYKLPLKVMKVRHTNPNYDWTETGIVFDNRPVTDEENDVIGETITTGADATHYEFDITNWVNEEKAAGRDIVNLHIRAYPVDEPVTTTSTLRIYTKERNTAAVNLPMLIIEGDMTATGISDTSKADETQEISVYNGLLKITNIEGTESVEIITLSGHKIIQQQITSEGLDLNNLKKGVYIVKTSKLAKLISL